MCLFGHAGGVHTSVAGPKQCWYEAYNRLCRACSSAATALESAPVPVPAKQLVGRCFPLQHRRRSRPESAPVNGRRAARRPDLAHVRAEAQDEEAQAPEGAREVEQLAPSAAACGGRASSLASSPPVAGGPHADPQAPPASSAGQTVAARLPQGAPVVLRQAQQVAHLVAVPYGPVPAAPVAAQAARQGGGRQVQVLHGAPHRRHVLPLWVEACAGACACAGESGTGRHAGLGRGVVPPQASWHSPAQLVPAGCARPASPVSPARLTGRPLAPPSECPALQ